MKLKTLYTSIAVLLLAIAVFSRPAVSDMIVTVTLDITPLTTAPGSSAGPFALAFQLNDGSGLGDANNTATLSNFLFGGGSAGAGCPGGPPCTYGGGSGDMASTVTLTDSDPFFNAFIQTFTPGTSLSFQLDLTANVDSGVTPDAFAMSILDSSGFSIPTLDPSGADTLLTINIDSANPSILAYGTDSSRLTNGGSGVSVSMDAPSYDPVAAPVPEPGSLSLIILGLASAGTALRRKLLR